MKTFYSFFSGNARTMVLGVIAFLFHILAYAAPQDVDLTGPSPNLKFTYNFSVGAPLPLSQIGVLNAGATVFWEFSSTPPGATSTDGFSTNFTFRGITVTFPVGTPASVPSASVAKIAGTPTIAGSFSFKVQVADEVNPALTRVREYELIIAQPMDLLLVLDRSGSMSTAIPAGGTRWDALKNTAANFGNMYQALNRTNDRIGITYFSTNTSPASVCCGGLVAVNSTIGTTISNDITGTGPGGSTALGLGLKDAMGRLSDPSKARSVLVITDGEQNVNPLVSLNGLGYSDGTSIPGSTNPGDVKIFTIGIGSPSGDFHTTLQNLATGHRGSYNTTDDGTSFNFQAGASGGDLSSGFTDQFVSILSSFSPQLVERSSTQLSGTAPFSLQSFPLNKRVNKLLLEFSFDKKFETPQLVQALGKIIVKKNGTLVTSKARPSWVGNYTNTVLLTFDFDSTAASVGPEGDWTVELSDLSNLNAGFCNLTTLADDHRLHLQRAYGNSAPKVNDSLPISLTLDWLSYPVTNASVQALILRPGEDIGDILATNPLKVDVSSAADAGSPGLQKFEKLWATDSAFRAKLARSNNTVTLTHTSGGKYSGSFSGLTVAGVYKILFLVSGTHVDAGKYKRLLSESFYTSFSSVDLAQSAISSQISGNTLVMQIRPKTSYGKFVGPAIGRAFAVSDPGITISNVTDHQDGSYTITFTGNINNDVILQLLGQEIYKGKLEDAGKAGSSVFAHWYIWALLLLIILILWLVFRKK